MYPSAFTVTVVVSTAWALVFGLRLAPREDRPPRGWFRSIAWHPLAQLLVVCALLLANQILCSAYILRVHHGDPAFVTRYLPPGWFAISRSGLVESVAAHAGEWLSPTVLRVQAFLELPFVVFAYLAVARLLGGTRTLLHPALLVGASVSFTIAFCLVELSLPNPWTRDDIVLRVLSMIVTPGWVWLAARLEGGVRPSQPRGLGGLIAFVVGAAAIAYLVLALYDAFLLYNLAHLPRYALGLACAIPIAVVATWAAPRFAPGGPNLAMAAHALGTFTLLFFVPALVLRYWGQHLVAQLCGCVLIAISVGIAIRRTTIVGGIVAAAGGAVAGGAAVVSLGGVRFPELALATFACTFLVVAILVLAAFDRMRRT